MKGYPENLFNDLSKKIEVLPILNTEKTADLLIEMIPERYREFADLCYRKGLKSAHAAEILHFSRSEAVIARKVVLINIAMRYQVIMDSYINMIHRRGLVMNPDGSIDPNQAMTLDVSRVILTNRETRALRNSGINTISDILSKSKEEIARISGDDSVTRICTFTGELGLAW